VNEWVRQSIVYSPLSDHDERENKVDNQRRLIQVSAVYRPLLTLGFRRCSGELGDYLLLPGIEKSMAVVGKNMFSLSESDPNCIYNHLTRFGLPSTCHFDRITTQQRQQLELLLAENPQIDTL
jgi:hypothetical protein